jgi:hypothetical protein
VIVESQRDEIRSICETIERESGKNRLKWYDASHRARMAYIRGVLSRLPSNVQLCFAPYQDSLDYFMLTVDAIVNAIRMTTEITSERESVYKVTALVDGLPRSRERMIGSLLRKRGIRIDKVRGVKREENDVLIRLADALCGGVTRSSGRKYKMRFNSITWRGEMYPCAS